MYLYSGELGESSGNIFFVVLQGMITEGYKTMNSENTVFLKGGGEDVTNNGCGWLVPFKSYATSKMELFVTKNS